MNEPKRECICSAVLQQILQTGELDIPMVMRALVSATGSAYGLFFLVHTDAQRYLCQFSTLPSYVRGREYTFGEIPLEQITVMHKSLPIASIVLENQDEFDNWPVKERQRTMDAICIGLVMSKLKNQRYDLTMSVYSECREIVDRMNTAVTAAPRLSAVIDKPLAALTRLVFLASDYMSIDMERIQLNPETADVRAFFRKMVEMFTTGNVDLTFTDDVPRSVIVDHFRIQQIIVGLFSQIDEKTKANLVVDFADYSTQETPSFFLVITLSATTPYFARQFMIERLSTATLELSICKRLCELLSGTYDVTDNALTIKVKVGLDDAQQRDRKNGIFW